MHFFSIKHFRFNVEYYENNNYNNNYYNNNNNDNNNNDNDNNNNSNNINNINNDNNIIDHDEACFENIIIFPFSFFNPVPNNENTDLKDEKSKNITRMKYLTEPEDSIEKNKKKLIENQCPQFYYGKLHLIYYLYIDSRLTFFYFFLLNLPV